MKLDVITPSVIPETSDRYLTLGEVQQILKVSRSTIWRWTTEHGLKVVRVGAMVRIRESDLQKFLARHESDATLAPTPSNSPGEPVSVN